MPLLKAKYSDGKLDRSLNGVFKSVLMRSKPDIYVKYEIQDRQICIFLEFQTSKLPHYQIKINVSKVKTRLLISRFPNFHTITLPS